MIQAVLDDLVPTIDRTHTINQIQHFNKRTCETEVYRSKKHFLECILSRYRQSRQYYATSRIKCRSRRDPDQVLFIKPLLRFTEKYRNRIQYQIWPLFEKKIKAWVTLTAPLPADIGQWYKSLTPDGFRARWPKFRAMMSKIGMRAPDYMKVYELTDNHMIHIHVAFYQNMTKDQLAKLLEYWHRQHGFQKSYYYENHKEGVIVDSYGVEKRSVVAERFESWYHNQGCAEWCRKIHEHGTIEWKPQGWKRIDTKLAHYVTKYMLKQPSEIKQAILTEFRVRTFDCSQSIRAELNSLDRPSKGNWKFCGFVEQEQREGFYEEEMPNYYLQNSFERELMKEKRMEKWRKKWQLERDTIGYVEPTPLEARYYSMLMKRKNMAEIVLGYLSKYHTIAIDPGGAAG